MGSPTGLSLLRRNVSGLPLLERSHLLVRYRSAPWERIVPALSRRGRLLDVGCGPGLLAHLLHREGFEGTYLGIDPDPRKVERAKVWPGEAPRRTFLAAPVGDVPAGSFDEAVLVDVLYLVPRVSRAAFLAEVVKRLAPAGRLVTVTSGGGPGWKRLLDRAQEFAAVSLLGFTKGAAIEPCDGAEVARGLTSAGLVEVGVTDIGAGYLHGFELVSGRLAG